MYPQLPQEEDPNIIVDRIIEDRLFNPMFTFREQDEMMNQYNYEMMPYIYPDDNPDDLEGVL
jgi:hypothetical protein